MVFAKKFPVVRHCAAESGGIKIRIQLAILVALVGVLVVLWWPSTNPDRKLVRQADELFREQLVGKVELADGPWEVNAETTQYKYRARASLVRQPSDNVEG